MPTLRFVKGGAYTSDLTSICNAIRANGTAVTIGTYTITHPLVAGNIQVLLNLAFQSNSNLPLATASLYVLGFTNAHGTFTFALTPFLGGPIPGAVTLAGIDGSYASLGYDNGFGSLQLTDATLQSSIQTLQAYAGGAYPPALKPSLARLILASSEALRLTAVGNSVNGVLGNTAVYLPDWDAVHAWGGHVLGF